jgi:hypothetical protein
VANRTAPQDHPGCPLGIRCESCGCAGPELRVSVMDVLGHELCLTMCGDCRASGTLPTILVATAYKLISQHAEHVAPAPEPRRVIP